MERKGIHVAVRPLGEIPLLLVVHCSGFDFLAIRIRCPHGDGTAFAVRRYDNSTRGSNLAVFLVGQLGRAVVNCLIRPRVCTRIAGEGVVFPVELSRPLVVRGLTLAIGAIYRNFHVVTHGLVDNCVVLRCHSGHLRLGLVQLPGAQIRAAGKARCHCKETQSHSQYNRSCFHVPPD